MIDCLSLLGSRSHIVRRETTRMPYSLFNVTQRDTLVAHPFRRACRFQKLSSCRSCSDFRIFRQCLPVSFWTLLSVSVCYIQSHKSSRDLWVLTILCPGLILSLLLLPTLPRSFTSRPLPRFCLCVLFYVYYCVYKYLFRMLLVPLSSMPIIHVFAI
jgi:hypothetical protein